MPLKLRSQDIYMIPLKGRLVEACIGSDMVGDEVEFWAGENAKGFGLDFPEGRMGRNAAVSEEFEHLPCLVEILIAFDAVRIDASLGRILGFVGIPSHMMEQAVEQMIEALLTSFRQGLGPCSAHVYGNAAPIGPQLDLPRPVRSNPDRRHQFPYDLLLEPEEKPL